VMKMQVLNYKAISVAKPLICVVAFVLLPRIIEILD
jgi:hypothetical protein